MADEQNTVVEVQSGDTIDALLQRLTASAGRKVSLIIPQSASVPATLPEFEQLRELEKRAGMTLTLVVDPRDRTRFGLAKILSFNVRTSEMTAAAPNAEEAAATIPTIAPPPTSSRAATPPATPSEQPLPDDIAGMNFDADELDAAAPPPPRRVIGGDPFASPNPPPRDILDEVPPTSRSRRQSREAAPATTGYSSDTSAQRSSGKIKMKAKTLGGLTESETEAQGNAAVSDGLRLPAGAIRNQPIPPAVLEQTEPIIPDDTGFGVPAARRRRRENTAAHIAASATLAAAPDEVAATSPTMKVKIKTSNGAWEAEDGEAATAATSDTRPPAQSKSAAAAAIPMRGAAVPVAPTRPRVRDAEAARRDRERTRNILFVGLAAFVVLAILGVGYFLLNPNSGILGGNSPGATVTLLPRSINVTQQVSVPISVSNQAMLPSLATYRAEPSSRNAALLMPAIATDTTPLTSTTRVTPTATLPPFPSTAIAAPVTAQVINVVVSETGTIKTSGVRKEARGNDTTTLKIVNPNGGAVTIAAGTRISGGSSGFAFANTVTIPGSNLLGGYIGTAFADVQAIEVGPSGVSAYTLSGSVAGVQYQNTTDATGATIVDIPTVAEGDYNNLIGGLIAKSEARIPDEIAAQVNGRVLITATIMLDGEPQVSANHKVGEDADSITATVVRTAHAYAFNPQDATAAAIAALQQSIVTADPNVAIDNSSVKVAPGQLQSNSSGYVYQASATASGVYMIDQATLAGVKQLLIGQKATNPAALKQLILAKYPRLADAQIQITAGSGNNDGTMPADKITVKATAAITPTPTK